MCLILFAWQAHPDYRLVVAANRDETYRRPTEPMHRWDHPPDLIAGRDVTGNGTWLGIRDSGRFAAVTNVRQGTPTSSAPRSRGQLPIDFLTAASTPDRHVRQLAADDLDEYAAFNLLVADAESMWWTSNRPSTVSAEVAPGIHGLSNASLDTSWPKVDEGKADFAAVLETDDGRPGNSVDAYFDVLADRGFASRDTLPDTRVSPFMERRLSARFVRLGMYGTRASTVLRVRHDGGFDITERRFGAIGYAGSTKLEHA